MALLSQRGQDPGSVHLCFQGNEPLAPNPGIRDGREKMELGGSPYISLCFLPHPDFRDQKRRRDPLSVGAGTALFSGAKLADVPLLRLGIGLSLKALLP